MSPIIRLATEQDAMQVLEIYAPFCGNSPVSFEFQSPTLGEMQQRIINVLQKLPWLVCERHGSLLGFAYAVAHRERAAYQWSVEVSVYIRPAERRSGIGRALYTSLFQVLVLQGYYNAYAGVTLPNPGSVQLHEAMGFQSVSIYRGVGYKSNAWHDVAWFELLLQPRVIAPNPPVAISGLHNTTKLKFALENGIACLKDR